jgi:hypothetical protein
VPDRSRPLRICGLAGSLVLLLSCAREAAAFGPDAAVAVGTCALGAVLPEGQAPAWSGRLAGAVTQQVEAEQTDPERYVWGHRFDGLAVMDAAPAADAVSTAAEDAPQLFARAADSLRAAFESGDPANWSGPIASLALAACDLADPFQMTSPGSDEVPGARAWFSDGAAAATLEWLSAAGTRGASGAEVATPYRALDAALALARASAGLRDSVERLARSEDGGALEALQRDRLAAAAGVAQAATAAAWQAATSAGSVTGTLRLWPNPVRDVATLSFVLPAAGAVRLELFDVAGRRVSASDLGSFPAGPHTASFHRGQAGPLAPGVYLARLFLPGQTATGRIVLTAR